MLTPAHRIIAESVHAKAPDFPIRGTGAKHHEAEAQHHEQAVLHHLAAAKHEHAGRHKKVGHYAYLAHAHRIDAEHLAATAAKTYAKNHAG